MLDPNDYIRITPEGHIRTTSSSLYDYIVSYVPLPTINKMVGDPIALPNTVTVTRKSGKVETLIVKWEPVSTDVAGTFSISGGVDNSVFVVTQVVVVSQLTDLDILRQIRDANPTSQLPTLWSEDKDPYTQWWNATESVGVLFGGDIRLDQFAMDSGITTPPIAERNPLKAYVLTIFDAGMVGDLNVTGLAALQYLDCNSNQLTTLDVTGLAALQGLYCDSNQLTTLDVTGLAALQYLDCNSNQLTTLDVTGLAALEILDCSHNQLTAIPTLTSKGLMTTASFTHNLMFTPETDRLLAMGFNSAQVLPQDI